MKRFLILIIAAVIAVGTTAGCRASERSANDKAVGGTEQAKPANADNKTLANKADENKPAAKSEVLWDFRKDDFSKSPTFSKSETEAVVKYLFGEGASAKIEIRDRISGAFTKPNAKETLYYLTGCEDETSGQFTTDCPHVSWDSVGWIAIYDGTTPVLKIEQPLGYSVEKVTDVNGDGKNEFLSFGGYAQGGIQTGGAALGQISDGRYEEIKSFKGYADNCAFGVQIADKLTAKAVVIKYVSTSDGKMPEFTEEYFRGQCKNEAVDKSSWKATTKKDFEDFFDSLS